MFTPHTAGIFLGLEDSIYRSAPGVSNSALKNIKRSPAHYLAALMAKPEPTPAQIFGTIFHAGILEPHLFESNHVVRPEGMTFQTKEGRAWRDSQTVPIITREESEAIRQASYNVWAHPIAGEIIGRAQTEVSGFAPHEPTGLFRKGRADLVFTDNDGLTCIADIKTCEDASTEEFAYQAGKFGYHRQAAYYLDVFGASKFLFIAVEKTDPFAVNVMQVTEAAIERGRETNERYLSLLAECEASGQWPAYAPMISSINVRSFHE